MRGEQSMAVVFRPIQFLKQNFGHTQSCGQLDQSLSLIQAGDSTYTTLQQFMLRVGCKDA